MSEATYTQEEMDECEAEYRRVIKERDEALNVLMRIIVCVGNDTGNDTSLALDAELDAGIIILRKHGRLPAAGGAE